jgi:sulfite reductase alpha subunit-like flavoprotein
MEFDEFPITQLPVTKVPIIFVIATTGDGEAPTTMQKAWKFLMRADLKSGDLRNVKFTTFGLGDSSYALFNAMAKKMTQRLLNLGA